MSTKDISKTREEKVSEIMKYFDELAKEIGEVEDEKKVVKRLNELCDAPIEYVDELIKMINHYD